MLTLDLTLAKSLFRLGSYGLAAHLAGYVLHTNKCFNYFMFGQYQVVLKLKNKNYIFPVPLSFNLL